MRTGQASPAAPLGCPSKGLAGLVSVAEQAEVDIHVPVVRLGVDAEFVGGVLAEAADVLGQVRRDVGQVLWVDLPCSMGSLSVMTPPWPKPIHWSGP